jgi:mannose-6-phosphate isomerase
MTIEPLLVEKPWGGTWLGRRYGSSKTIGEAWLLSTLKEGQSQIDGRPLREVVGDLKFVVKIIDTAQPLSVQVHPNDEWASKLEHSRGKTECWLILDAKPGAGVYMGLAEGVSGEEFAAALAGGRSVETLVRFYPVQRGDFIVVPAGTIHAIGAGVTLLEVQQASGITYRLWDWDRPGRELHIDKGLQVASFASAFAIQKDVLSSAEPRLLLKHSDFQCFLNESHGEGWFIDLDTYDVYRASQARSSSHFIFVK